MFNELQQEGLGAATLRHALITSKGCLKSKGQTAQAIAVSMRKGCQRIHTTRNHETVSNKKKKKLCTEFTDNETYKLQRVNRLKISLFYDCEIGSSWFLCALEWMWSFTCTPANSWITTRNTAF